MLKWLHKNLPRDPKTPVGVALDPMCGMEVRPENAAATRTVDERVLYFCSKACAERFDDTLGEDLALVLARDGHVKIDRRGR